MRTIARLGAAALLAAVVAVPAAQAGETFDRVMSTKTLTMSSDPEYPPQSFLNDDNEMDGFDVDIGKEIAERLGVELEIVIQSWAIITAGNCGGRWDISVSSMTPTKQRVEVLEFPAVNYNRPAYFAVHEESTIATLDQLHGTTNGAT